MNFYRLVAKQGWGGSKHYTYTQTNPNLRKWLVHHLRRDSTVLTVGCGSGEFERDLKEQNHEVVGIDVSAEMIQAASSLGVRGLIQADAHLLPFRSACFDVVIFPESLGYLRLDEAIRETARVLTKSGRVLITTYPSHSRVHSLYKLVAFSELRRRLSESGLRVRRLMFLKTTHRQVRVVRSERPSTLVYLLATKSYRIGPPGVFPRILR